MKGAIRACLSKGKRVNIPVPEVDADGNISELADGSGESGKSYLFFLTACSPGISLAGEGVTWLGKHLTFRGVRCLSDAP